MTVYGIVLGFILFFNFVLQYSQKRISRKVLIAVSGIVLWLTACLRAETLGADMGNYLKWYNLIAETPVAQWPEMRKIVTAEYGYILFCKILTILSISPRGFIIITSFLVLIGPLSLIYRYSSKPWISFWIFIVWGFYTAGFNIIRQSIGISIVCLAIPFIIHKKPIKFIIMILLASCFHKTMCAFSLLYLAQLPRLRMVYWWCWGIANIILFFFSEKIIGVLLHNLFHYEVYLTQVGTGNKGGLLIVSLAFFGVILLFQKYQKLSDTIEISKISVSLAVSFSILTLSFGLMSRVATSCLFLMILFLPDMVNLFAYRSRPVVVTVLIVVTLFYGYYYIYRLDYSNVFPYIFMS